MADISPDYQRGFLLPYNLSKQDIYTAEKNYTEQSLKAGTAEASSGTKQVVECTGEQQNTIQIQTLKGGTAGRGAGFGWKLSTDTDYYGANSINALNEYKMLKKGSVVDSYGAPAALATSEGDILISYKKISGSLGYIYTAKKAAGGTAFGGGSIVVSGSTSTSNYSFPALVELLDGSILLVCWREYPLTSAGAQLYVYRSVDAGENFDLVSSGALDAPVDRSIYTLGRIHLAQYEGQILLIGELVSNSGSNYNVALQAASIDGGASFTTIGTTADHDFVYRPSIVVNSKGFAVTYISNETSAVFYQLPNAFTSLKTLVSGSSTVITVYRVGKLVGNQFTDGDHTSWIDERGIIYTAFKNTDLDNHTNGGNGGWWLQASADNGSTWYLLGNGSGNPATTSIEPYFFSMNTDTLSLSLVSAVAGQGAFYLFSNLESTVSNLDASIVYIALSGYSTVTAPPRVADGDWKKKFGYVATYLPLDLPDTSSSWTLTQTGGTSGITDTGLDIDTAATEHRYYNYSTFPASLSMTDVNGAIVRFAVTATSGGSVVNADRMLDLQIGGTTLGYRVQCRVDGTNIRLYDAIGTATLATVAPAGGYLSTSGVEILLAMAGGKVSGWYREDDQLSAKKWIEIGTNLSCANGGSLSNRVRFGHFSSSGTIESRFREVCISGGSAVGANMAAGFTNPADLETKEYPEYGVFQYIAEGLQITTKDSPAYEGDTYTIEPRPENGIENLFLSTSPTPQKQWRSNSVVSGTVPEQLIPLLLDPNNQEIQFDSDLLGIHLSNINFRQFKIEGYDVGTGNWIVLADVDTAGGNLTASYSRYGRTIIGTAGNSPYFFADELVDWIVELPDGEGSPVFREVERNTEGSWTGASGSRNSIVSLKNTAASDPTSGIVRFVPNKASVAISLNGATYSAIALRIPAQYTLHKDFRIGSFVCGGIHIIAPQYARGRQVTFEANTAQFESPDGVRRARKIGKGKRQFQIQWSDPVDMSAVFPYDATATPDYYKASTSAGALAVANYGDYPFNIIGYCKRVAGTANPIVFFPSIAKSGGAGTDVRVLVRDQEAVLCTLPNDVSIEHVVGNEFRGNKGGEAFRVSTIQLLEVI